MRRMQDKMVSAIEQAVKSGATPTVVEVVLAPEYASTGHLFVHATVNGASNWSPGLVVRYGFQSTYCSIDLWGPGIDALGLVDSPPRYRVDRWAAVDAVGVKVRWHSLRYEDGDRIAEMLEIVFDAARAGAAPRSVAEADGLEARSARRRQATT